MVRVVHLHSVAAGQRRLKKRIGPERPRARARPPHITNVYPQTRDAPNIAIGHIAGSWTRAPRRTLCLVQCIERYERVLGEPEDTRVVAAHAL